MLISCPLHANFSARLTVTSHQIQIYAVLSAQPITPSFIIYRVRAPSCW